MLEKWKFCSRNGELAAQSQMQSPRWSPWFVSGRGRYLGFAKEIWDFPQVLVLTVELESNRTCPPH